MSTTKSPKVSILVPIYNVEPYLAQCLASLLDQTLTDIEIICVNDGSTDNSPVILKEFAHNDPRITIINKKNTGYGDSMNRALAAAHGEYIGILEPDDYIDSNAFATMYHAAREHHADVVKCNYYRTQTSPKTGTTDTLFSEIPTTTVITPRDSRYVFQFAPAIWSAIYRRSFLLDNHIDFLPTPGASYQDLSFSFKVWTLASTVVLLPDAFVHYRIDNANSSVNNPGKVNCVVDEYAEIETFLCERGIFPEFGETMVAAKFRNYHWNFQRLQRDLARDFYQTWRQDLLATREDHLLQKSQFSKKDWLALQFILRHPRLAYHLLRLRHRLRHH